jgi:hypothetical protein
MSIVFQPNINDYQSHVKNAPNAGISVPVQTQDTKTQPGEHPSSRQRPGMQAEGHIE